MNAAKIINSCSNCGAASKNAEVLKSVELAFSGFEDCKLYENHLGSTNSNESLSSGQIDEVID